MDFNETFERIEHFQIQSNRSWGTCGRSWFPGCYVPRPGPARMDAEAQQATTSRHPCIRDRVVQMAAVLIIGALRGGGPARLEVADFRPGLDIDGSRRSAPQRVTLAWAAGRWWTRGFARLAASSALAFDAGRPSPIRRILPSWGWLTAR